MLRDKIGNASCIKSATYYDLKILNNSKSNYIITKSITLEPNNPEELNKLVDNRVVLDKNERYPKLFYEYIKGDSFNNCGLRNYGYNYYKDLKFNKPYIISISDTLENIEKILRDGEDRDNIDGYEINLECPNVEGDNNLDLNDEKDIYKILKVLSVSQKPFGIKIPSYEFIRYRKLIIILGRVNKFIKFSWITCCNTYPYNNNGIRCGIGGKFLKVKVKECIRYYKYLLNEENLDIDVIACGGITEARDVIEYSKVGADGYQMATGLIEEGPEIFSKIKKELKTFIYSKL